jgi:flagellar basal-body rod modification protein FlgD
LDDHLIKERIMVLAVSGMNATTPTSTMTNAHSLSQMTPQDFLQLLITQLKYQDPTQPVTNQDLLQQVSAIGQLQTSTNLNSTLTASSQQQQLASASAMIGKSIMGKNAQSQVVSGTVTSVVVQPVAQADGTQVNTVFLSLNSGQQVALANVSAVSPAGSSTAATTPGTTSQ